MSRRLVKQLLGRDVWSRVELAVPSVHLGSHYGGWTVCSSAGLNARSTVYSVGVGEDVSFDTAIHEVFGCEVYSFDPTPPARKWIETQLPSKPFLHFHPWGLAGSDGTLRFAAPKQVSHVSFSAVQTEGPFIHCEAYRLSTIMGRLGHPTLDLLKMDIEGSEYGVISDMHRGALRPHQVLVEFHHGMYGISNAMTYEALRAMAEMKYRIFSISNTGREYSFILTNGG